MLIGLVDLDVLLQSPSFSPSIELMLASSYYKKQKHIVKMVYDLNNLSYFDKIIVSKGQSRYEKDFTIPYELLTADCDWYGEYFYGGAIAPIPIEWFGSGIGDTSIYYGADVSTANNKTKKIFHAMRNTQFCKFSQNGKLIVDKVPLGHQKLVLYDENIFSDEVFPFVQKLLKSHRLAFYVSQSTKDWEKFKRIASTKNVTSFQRNVLVGLTELPSKQELIDNVDIFTQSFVIRGKNYSIDTPEYIIINDIIDTSTLLKEVSLETGKRVYGYPTVQPYQDKSLLLTLYKTFFYYLFYADPRQYSFIEYLVNIKAKKLLAMMPKLYYHYPRFRQLVREKWS